MLDKVVAIRAFSIVVVADNQNPSILNPDFLKYNHIVPFDWELAMPPICLPALSQVVYKNGVNILAESDGVLFGEEFETNDFSVKVPEVSSKYVEALPYIGYRAVGLNFTGHVFFAGKEDSESFVLNRLIASGAWKNFQGKLPDVDVSFTYPMENGSLTITVEGGFQEISHDNETVNFVMFKSNFHRDILEIGTEEKVAEAKSFIQSWETNLSTFRSVVEETFLVGNEGKEL